MTRKLIKNNLKIPFVSISIGLFVVIVLAFVMIRKTFLQRSLDDSIAPFQTGDDCTAPCWMGIKPGSSTESDFRNIIEGANEGRFAELKCISVYENQQQCNWKDRVEKSFSRVLIKDGVISYLLFAPVNDIDFDPIEAIRAMEDLAPDPVSPYDQQARFTLGDIIKILNEPDSYSLVENVGFEGGHFFYLTVFFEEDGIAVTVRTVAASDFDSDTDSEAICNTKITQEMAVNSIYFFDPSIPDETVGSLLNIEAVLGEIKPWKGFAQTDPFLACWGEF